jgi:flavorubredoxin
MLISNANKTSGITAADFDAFDNSESEDLVRLAVAQTLTNKTIDAGSNTISGINTTNFLLNVVKTSMLTLGTPPTTGVALPSVEAVMEYVEEKRNNSKVFAINNAATLTITAVQHGLNPAKGLTVQVYETVSTNKVLVEADVSIASSGNVVVTLNQNITGHVVIMGTLT